MYYLTSRKVGKMMNDKYKTLLSPIRLGGIMLRNRMICSAGTPHFLQGIMKYPTENIIAHYARAAKNGAAVVTINQLSFGEEHVFDMPGGIIDNVPKHFVRYDMEDPNCHTYVCQLIDAIHFYGAKAAVTLSSCTLPEDAALCDPEKPAFLGVPVEKITEEYIARYSKTMAEQALIYKRLGFDMISIHCAYRGGLFTRMLSPLTNHRTDELGGSLENRAKFLLRMFEAIKDQVGEEFPLEAQLSGSEPDGGYTIDDLIRLAKMAEGTVDLLTIRAGDVDPQHPTGHISSPDNPTPTLCYSAALKEAGVKMRIGGSGGYQNADWNEKILRENMLDIVEARRAWICEPEYGAKIRAGRGEDIAPCIRCNKCHTSNPSDMYRSVCSINPLIGFEHKLAEMIPEKSAPKKVAVVGGGPAGMYAAITAADRGHRVELYEKTGVLGGQLLHADYVSFKWPLRDYKNYLIRQVQKRDIAVHLNCEINQETLAGQGYDHILIAAGPQYTLPDIPGAELPMVLRAEQVFGHEEELANEIVVIRGNEIGVDTAMHLAQLGHEVTVIEKRESLIGDSPRAHYQSIVEAFWKTLDHFHYVVNAVPTEITPNGVTYQGKDGTKHFVPCGNVILSTGSRPQIELLEQYYGIAPVELIGDCETRGNVQKAIRQAYAAAVNL